MECVRYAHAHVFARSQVVVSHGAVTSAAVLDSLMALLILLGGVSLAIALVSILVVSLAIWTSGKRSLRIDGQGRVLLITAHPDDECMFFAPAIVTLTRADVEIFLLCLSEGNYYGQGHVRRRELIKSAAILGMDEDHVTIVDDRGLPDDPSVEWNEDLIGNYIVEAVSRHGIKTIVTFDEKGVSHHPNHIAISKAIKKLHNNKTLDQEVFLLESVNVLRKYSSWFDVWWTVVNTKTDWVSLNWKGYIRAKKSMAMHQSQYLWFRRLYVTFSRYMIINSFKRL